MAAQNASGGCLIAWRRCYALVNSWATPHTITAYLADNKTCQHLFLTTVYGPRGDASKLAFINEISRINIEPSALWLLGGDFNLTRWLTDRPNASPQWALMDAFNDMIRRMQLFDVPLKGRKFTWTNKHPNPNFSKIDKIFLTPAVLTTFRYIELQPGTMVTSDHIPLIFSCSHQGGGPTASRIERFWLHYDDFNVIFNEIFGNPPQLAMTNPIDAFKDNLRQLHGRLRTWHKCKFTNADTYLNNCKHAIAFLDALEECRILTQIEMFIRIKARERAYELASNDETKWYQRARCKWMSLGDKNTKYFHALAFAKQRNKEITKINHRGGDITDQSQINQVFLTHFQELLGYISPISYPRYSIIV